MCWGHGLGAGGRAGAGVRGRAGAGLWPGGFMSQTSRLMYPDSLVFPDNSQMFPVPPLPVRRRRCPRRDSKSEKIICGFYCLKLTCKIVAKSCQNQCYFGHFFELDFTENHVRVDCSFACPFE